MFFDHNLSHVLPEALQAVFSHEHKIVALQTKFPRDIARAERHVFQTSKLTGFFMAPALKKAPVIKQLERLCALWANIITLASAAAPGALYELPIKTTSPRQLRL